MGELTPNPRALVLHRLNPDLRDLRLGPKALRRGLKKPIPSLKMTEVSLRRVTSHEPREYEHQTETNRSNIGASIIRIGFSGTLYCNHIKEPPQQYWSLFRPLKKQLASSGRWPWAAEGSDKNKSRGRAGNSSGSRRRRPTIIIIIIVTTIGTTPLNCSSCIAAFVSKCVAKETLAPTAPLYSCRKCRLCNNPTTASATLPH